MDQQGVTWKSLLHTLEGTSEQNMSEVLSKLVKKLTTVCYHFYFFIFFLSQQCSLIWMIMMIPLVVPFFKVRQVYTSALKSITSSHFLSQTRVVNFFHNYNETLTFFFFHFEIVISWSQNLKLFLKCLLWWMQNAKLKCALFRKLFWILLQF